MDSDSEDFQSADEDVEIEVSKKNKENPSTISSSAVSKESASDSVKQVDKPIAKVENNKPTQKPEPAPQTEKSVTEVDADDGWEIEDWDAVDDEGPAKNVVEAPKLPNVAPKTESKEPNISSVMDKLVAKEEQPSQSWGWGNKFGGAFSLLSSASKNVASLTTQVSQSLSSVIESGMGVPNPEELAKIQIEESKKLKADKTEEELERIQKSEEKEDIFGLNQIVSGVTHISSKVISGGLDTLEGIGKKTMNILQDGDPGLKNKRNILGFNSDKTVLSQVLREAKEKTEETEKKLKHLQKQSYKKKLHFELLFDDYQGLIHLEALEMLSKQASIRIECLTTPLTGKALRELEETLDEVKELCELPDPDNEEGNDGFHTTDDLQAKLNEATADLSIEIDFGEILKAWDDTVKWLGNDENKKLNAEALHDKALHSLAENTALIILKMHKLGEQLLILDHHSSANEADSLVQMTTIFCWHLSGISSRFSDSLNHVEGVTSEETNSLITNIFLEGSNSTSYVQNAFQLFIPIIQIGAV